MRFLWVPPGALWKGCLGPVAGPGARPVPVEGFWIAKYPVTQDQWERVMGANGSHFRSGGDRPVEQVSYREAVAFARRLTMLVDDGTTFALPRETQWEYAARSGGRQEAFSGGSDPEAVAWFRDNSGFATHPVGRKAPNGLGCCDMSGNVMEWCSDLFFEGGSSFESIPDPSDSSLRRVCRGGSWRTEAALCRTVARRGIAQGLRYTDLGFRLVRTS
jgi:formylglycine-generating enzyme required for sulfatase activity